MSKVHQILDYSFGCMQSIRITYYREKSLKGDSKMLANDFEFKISYDLKNHCWHLGHFKQAQIGAHMGSPLKQNPKARVSKRCNIRLHYSDKKFTQVYTKQLSSSLALALIVLGFHQQTLGLGSWIYVQCLRLWHLHIDKHKMNHVETCWWAQRLVGRDLARSFRYTKVYMGFLVETKR